LIRVGQVLYLVILHEALEGDGFDLRILGIIQVLLEVCLSVDAVVLVEPELISEAPASKAVKETYMER
jgi:hypothetical protein